MKRLPIKAGYCGQDVIIYLSGEYMIINNVYYLFFIANMQGIIYDTVLWEKTSVSITDTEVKTVKGEVFKKI